MERVGRIRAEQRSAIVQSSMDSTVQNLRSRGKIFAIFNEAKPGHNKYRGYRIDGLSHDVLVSHETIAWTFDKAICARQRGDETLNRVKSQGCLRPDCEG